MTIKKLCKKNMFMLTQVVFFAKNIEDNITEENYLCV